MDAVTSKEESNGSQAAAVDQTLMLLKARDDTSRFVGLSLLRSLLDSNEDLRTNEEVLMKCWNAISNKFLIRLMKTDASKKSKDEAKDMVDLAISVVHIFANLLPAQEVGGQKMIDFCDPLVQVIPKLQSKSQKNAFQALQCISSTASGAAALIAVQDWKECIATAGKNEEFLVEFFRLRRAASTASPESQRGKLDIVIEATIQSVRDHGQLDATRVLEALGELTSEVSYSSTPYWIPYAISLIRTTIKKLPTSRGRVACIRLVGNLIQGLPPSSNFAYTLFNETKLDSTDSKPFSYIFINLVLIEIRSTIPSLLEQLASNTYTSTALRLAACYDIMSAFIMYLLQHLDSDADITECAQESILPPDTLLKIRRDFSETLSLTLEFFRDRWDATISGAGGLDPSARIDPNAPLALTWDNPSVSPAGDPIILAGLRALSLWLREDENIELQKEATSLMDMFIALYASSTATDTKVDFRHAILTCLSGLLPESDDAVQYFLDQKGWSILQEDLERSFLFLQTHNSQLLPAHTQDIIRVLITVLESDTVPQTREAWMAIVRLMSRTKPPSLQDREALETLLGGWQLAVALVVKAPQRLRKSVSEDAKSIKLKSETILREARGKIDDGLSESLIEIIDGLDGIV